MLRKVVLLFLPILLSAPTVLNGQTPGTGLFVPAEIMRAYENGTRSTDGSPGPNYWQNHARYNIDVRLEPEEMRLFGTETVTYLNNSPDPLNLLVIRLQYDVYKKGNARDEAISAENVSDGVQIENLRIAGNDIDLEAGNQARRRGTNLLVNLINPLEPGDSLSLGIDWNTQVPYRGIRTGAKDSSSFFMGYWYPQIAVYDDIGGWDMQSYTGRVEFYSDLADFDVHIQMPPRFMVHATGELQNPQEVLPTAVREAYEAALQSNETQFLISEEDAGNSTLRFGGEWHYRARNVPDFAFFTSDHYVWEASSLELDGRRVFISSLYPPGSAAGTFDITQMQRTIMEYFSTEISGIPYPYPAYASVYAVGGGGMEFPMMANNGTPPQEWSMASLTAHEMHHMYFPFYVRINEKRYAWMDEGWADYITDLALEDMYGDDFTQQAMSNVTLALSDTRLGDRDRVPLITPSIDLTGANYVYLSYMFPHYAYMTLHELLGEETFREAFREYIRRWAYKSPTPYDFFNTFEDVSGQDLDWFWEPWFFEFSAANVAVAQLDENRVTVKRLGDLPTSLVLTITYADGTQETVRETPSIWKEGKDTFTYRATGGRSISRVVLNTGHPDLDDRDNLALSESALAALGDLSRYSGTYSINPAVNFFIEAEKDRLVLTSDRMDFNVSLLSEGQNRFSSVDGSIKIRFREDGQGNIGFMTAELFGQEVDARKED